MSIKTVPMYRVVCDGCGTSAQDEGDYFAWADADQAESEAESSEWLVGDNGRHWCTGCIVCGDDGEMAPTPEALAASEQRALTGEDPQ